MQKRVLEVLKTWYFPYSAFWSAGQWGGYSTPTYPWLRYWLEHLYIKLKIWVEIWSSQAKDSKIGSLLQTVFTSSCLTFCVEGDNVLLSAYTFVWKEVAACLNDPNITLRFFWSRQHGE